MTNRSRTSERGITLIEMLVVVTIIALFAALVAPRMIGQADKATPHGGARADQFLHDRAGRLQARHGNLSDHGHGPARRCA